MANDQKQDIDLGITRLEYGDAERPQRAVLTVKTGKGYNGISSTATVFWHGLHSRAHLMGIGGGGDFSKQFYRAARTVKATQKAIDRQHAEVFTPEVIEQLTEAAKNHYADYVRAGIDGFKNVYVPGEVA